MALTSELTVAERGGATNTSAPLVLLAALAALVCATPALAAVLFSLAPSGGTLAAGGLLRDGVFGTLALVLVGGGGALLLGATGAWLVSLCSFPGRAAFEWLLVLPLAAPSYVLAYSYASLTWAGGPIPLAVDGFWGAAFVYAVGLYPYVYLAMRAGLAGRHAIAFEAARSLGARPGELFWRVALPLARPALVAGAALAAMEIAADYGAAQHFGLTTLSTAVFRAWYSHGEPVSALRIAAVLLAGALALLIAERAARGRARFHLARWRPMARIILSPSASAAAFGFCAVLVVLGAGLPLAWLGRLALLHANVEDLTGPTINTIVLASVGALATLCCAVVIAIAARRGGAGARLAAFVAGAGYAAPGAVIAFGALMMFGAARNAGWVGGLGSGVALTALLWTYVARFTAAGVQPIQAGLARAPADIDAAAATLGAGSWRRLIRIDMPVAAPSLAAAALILFVEIVKELPATLILRPLNFDTLAVKAHAYASDERLLEAAAPALLIFAAGLAPLLILSRGISRATP
ncbi:MAG: ABC transporter permease subunit [Terricaulis sp.]